MKDMTTKKEPNPGDAYIRIYLPPETQLELEYIAQDNKISRGRLITQIIEQYINKPPHEAQDGVTPITKDELNALLENIRAVKKWFNETEKRVEMILTKIEGIETEGEGFIETEDPDAARDTDVTEPEHAPPSVARKRIVIDVIRELEKEEGEANIDKIVERTAKAGLNEDDVNKEIAWLIQIAEIYESTDNPGNYLTVLRMERTRARKNTL